MSNDEKKTPPSLPGGAAVSHSEKGPARTHGQADPNTGSGDVLVVQWKTLSDNYAVLATEDGKAVGWVSREVDALGRELIRYGVGGLKRDAIGMLDGRANVVAHLADSALRVGMQLRVLNVRREDG